MQPPTGPSLEQGQFTRTANSSNEGSISHHRSRHSFIHSLSQSVRSRLKELFSWLQSQKRTNPVRAPPLWSTRTPEGGVVWAGTPLIRPSPSVRLTAQNCIAISYLGSPSQWNGPILSDPFIHVSLHLSELHSYCAGSHTRPQAAKSRGETQNKKSYFYEERL